MYPCIHVNSNCNNSNLLRSLLQNLYVLGNFSLNSINNILVLISDPLSIILSSQDSIDKFINNFHHQ